MGPVLCRFPITRLLCYLHRFPGTSYFCCYFESNLFSTLYFLIHYKKSTNISVSFFPYPAPLGNSTSYPTPVPWPGESHGRRSQAGCSPGRADEDTTEHSTAHALTVLHMTSSVFFSSKWCLAALIHSLKQEKHTENKTKKSS